MKLKAKASQIGHRLLQNPRIAGILKSDTVARGLVGALQVRTAAQQTLSESVQRAATHLGLATKDEVRALKRTLRKMETRLKKSESRND